MKTLGARRGLFDNNFDSREPKSHRQYKGLWTSKSTVILEPRSSKPLLKGPLFCANPLWASNPLQEWPSTEVPNKGTRMKPYIESAHRPVKILAAPSGDLSVFLPLALSASLPLSLPLPPNIYMAHPPTTRS